MKNESEKLQPKQNRAITNRSTGNFDMFPKNNETIGAFVRTKNNVKPVIVSPGHRITLDESIDLTLRTVQRYRIPEPTRLAHIFANQFRRGELHSK